MFSDTLNDLLSWILSEINEWYLDDGNLADDAPTVLQDFVTLTTKLEAIGLTLNGGKCELVFLDGQNEDTRRETLEAFRRVNCDVKAVAVADLVILGSPIGSRSMEETLVEKSEALQRLSSCLSELDSHHALFLLRNAFAIPKLLYILRTAPCSERSDLLQGYDAILRKALEGLSNVSVNDAAWQQASLPVSMGGIGISSATQLAPSAYLASAAGCSQLISLILPRAFTPEKHTEAISLWSSMADTNIETSITEPEKQKQWTEAVSKRSLELLRERSDDTTRARLSAHEGKAAGAWLNAYPSQALGTKLTNEQTRIALGLRLGQKIVEPHQCQCGAQVASDGRHGLACRKSVGRHPRHTILNDIVKRALATAGYPSILEPVGLTRGDGKRADGVTLIPWRGGRSLAWDATAVDALAPSNVARSASTPGSAAVIAEEKKATKYRELVDRGYIFQPVALELQGRMGPVTEKFIAVLGKKIAVTTSNNKAHSQLLQRLSIALQIGNAASVMGTLPAASREGLP